MRLIVWKAGISQARDCCILYYMMETYMNKWIYMVYNDKKAESMWLCYGEGFFILNGMNLMIEAKQEIVVLYCIVL